MQSKEIHLHYQRIYAPLKDPLVVSFLPLFQLCITNFMTCHDSKSSQELLHSQMNETVSVN